MIKDKYISESHVEERESSRLKDKDVELWISEVLFWEVCEGIPEDHNDKEIMQGFHQTCGSIYDQPIHKIANSLLYISVWNFWQRDVAFTTIDVHSHNNGIVFSFQIEIVTINCQDLFEPAFCFLGQDVVIISPAVLRHETKTKVDVVHPSHW